MRSKNQTGHIVVISSDAGRVPFPGLAVYCGTKFFVEGFLRSLRLESKPNEIVITSIQPGGITTPVQQWTTDTEAAQLFSPLHRPPEECRKAWEAMLKHEQVAEAVFFAVSQPKGTTINEVMVEPITGPV
nr:NRPS enzyme [Hymenolepis microstoma]